MLTKSDGTEYKRVEHYSVYCSWRIKIPNRSKHVKNYLTTSREAEISLDIKPVVAV